MALKVESIPVGLEHLVARPYRSQALLPTQEDHRQTIMNYPRYFTIAYAPLYSQFSTNTFWESAKSMEDYIKYHLSIDDDGNVGVSHEYIEVYQRDMNGNFLKIRTVGKNAK